MNNIKEEQIPANRAFDAFQDSVIKVLKENLGNVVAMDLYKKIAVEYERGLIIEISTKRSTLKK